MAPSPSLVFIVGAGASKAISPNMPVGSELAVRIQQALNEEFGGDPPRMNGPISKALQKLDGGLNEARIEAADRVRYAIARKESIDDLLNEWSDHVNMVDVAKIAIAHVILKSEAESYLAQKSNNEDEFLQTIGELGNTWLGLIARHLKPKLHRRFLEDALKDVGFVIFNYDRYVQQVLFGELRCQGVDQSSAYYAVEHLPIVHVYGSIGSFGGPSAVAPFGKPSQFLVPLYRSIHTYTEELYDGQQLVKMRDVLSGAKKTVFMGFGFHPKNMDHLINYGLNMQSRFYGASYKLGQERLDRARQQLFSRSSEDLVTNLTDMGCSDFIASFREEIFGT